MANASQPLTPAERARLAEALKPDHHWTDDDSALLWRFMKTLPEPAEEADTDKAQCFQLWKAGKRVDEIQAAASSRTKTVRGWVREWERGRQQTWTPRM